MKAKLSEQEKFQWLARLAGFTRRQGLFLWQIAVGEIPDYVDKDEQQFMERARRVTAMTNPKRKARR